MRNNFTGIIFSLIILISFVMGGYFFSQTQISLNSFLTINIGPLFESIISLDFLLFCVSISIGLGVMISLGSFYEIKKATIFATGSYLLSIIITVILFNLYDFLAPLLISAFTIVFCIKSLQKAREYKIFPILRIGIYSSSQFFLIFSTAFFFLLFFNSINQISYLESNFSNEILGSTIGNEVTLSDQFTLQLAQAIAKNQSDTIELMQNQEELLRMTDEGITDALIYNQKLSAYKTAYSEEEYIQKIAETMKNNQLNIGEEIVNKFPIIKLMAKYAFLLYPLSAFLLILFIGNIIIKNLAGLIFSGIVKYYPNIEETEKKA
ncbi:MAG: hypothetical protein PHY04_01570 [Candidatus ainarchaeum sp.]|jgi:hypothetical protein|nr:hypothetical protein [Candidatus ainarchaeum sp.]MDD3085637.1 hypothetical protein [Candidatus ainarchaeum sp.]MDD4128405.1 hypothetical protein [Candidatus ainarchaeum sp.]